MSRLVTTLVGLFVVALALSSTVFVVDQGSSAVLFSLGQVRDVVSEPGLHFKLPPPFQSVAKLDRRLLTLDMPDGERYSTVGKKDIQVDAFAKWRIAEPRQYYVAFGGDEAKASDRLAQLVKAALADEIAKRDAHEVIAGDRAKLTAAVAARVAAEAKQVGVEVADVRIKRVEYGEQLTSAVYDRMKAEREGIANAQRSTGSAEAEQIRADADRQRTVILAEAFRDAEKIKGEGDAKASQIYAQAFGKNPEFYKFYRSLEAYRATFRNHGDVMVLDPSSEFFKYFKNPGK